MRILKLWRYPVKSMLGESVDAFRIHERGVEGDRAYALEGRMASAKRLAALFTLGARTEEDGSVAIRFPDGRCLDVRDEALDEALSAVLGMKVSLAGAGPVQHFDDSPVHIVTTASLAWLRKRLPETLIDERRFRPNIVLEVEGESPVEQDWPGRRLVVGGAELEITRPCGRCVMTTLPQADLPADARVLRALTQEADGEFGVYARVVHPGRVAVGDPAS